MRKSVQSHAPRRRVLPRELCDGRWKDQLGVLRHDCAFLLLTIVCVLFVRVSFGMVLPGPK